MKLGNLLLVASLLIGSAVFAQGSNDAECERFIGVANNAMSAENYPEAVEYFLKAEDYCEDIGKDNYDRMLVCIQYLMATFEEGSDQYYEYMDKLMNYWEKSEKIGYYSESDDVIRGYYYTLLKEPDFEKADLYFARGIKNQGLELDDEVYIVLHYYNIYTLWFMEQDPEKKAELKQRYIKEYFDLTKLIKDANYAPSTQEILTKYLAQVITSCDDLTPEIPAFMSTLPEDPESKKTALMNMAELLEANQCNETDGYKTIVEAMYEAFPNDPDVQLKIVEIKSCGERIAIYKEIQSSTEDATKKNELQYKIASCYLEIGSFQAAFNAAKSVSGDLRSKALIIQAKAVAATANSCGDSTFDRKCNYLYAAQLMEQGGMDGSKYKALGPNADDCFNNNSPSSVTLTCWGVTVNPCQ